MDADRFDALSRTLITPGSRRATFSALFGALLGRTLPGSSPDAFAAGKGKGKTRHEHASAKHDHGGRSAGAEGRRAHPRQNRHQPHTQDATDEQTPRQTETTQLASGEVRASDVSAAACVEPGAKGCPKTACCATRCKKKKKKCLPCPAGTAYCASQAACVAPGQCAVSCAPGTADCNGDGSCETNTTNSNQHCGGCNKPCGTNQTCVNSICTGGLTCSPSPCPGDKVCSGATGFCTCPAERPVQCSGNTTRCSADPNTDSTRCGVNCVDCSVSFAPGYRCCGGKCVNGCGPASNSGCDGPCGPSCTPCSGGQFCCNLGSGTSSQCVDPVAGYCPTPPP
jgi:hypothetical protein